jgi:hypothetical protein
MTDKKPKLLWVADFAAMTGFGRVSGAILPRLLKIILKLYRARL